MMNGANTGAVSPFFQAVKENKRSKVARMLREAREKGIAINFEERDAEGQVPLELTIGRNYNMFLLLLENGANPNSVGKNGTMLNSAVALYNRDPRYAHELLRRGADVNYRHHFGYPFIAFESKHRSGLPIIKLFIEHGADVNARVRVPYTVYRDYEAFRELIAELRKFDNKTALYIAISKGQTEIAKLLAENGATVTPEIYDLLKSEPEGKEEIMEMLTRLRRRHMMTAFVPPVAVRRTPVAPAGADTRRGGRRSRRRRYTQRHRRSTL